MRWVFSILLAIAGIVGFAILDTLKLYQYRVYLQSIYPRIIIDDSPGIPQGLLHLLLIVSFAFWHNSGSVRQRSRRRLLLWILGGLAFTVVVRIVGHQIEDRFMWPVWETFMAQPARGG